MKFGGYPIPRTSPDDYTAHGWPRCTARRDGRRCVLPDGHWNRLGLPHECPADEHEEGRS